MPLSAGIAGLPSSPRPQHTAQQPGLFPATVLSSHSARLQTCSMKEYHEQKRKRWGWGVAELRSRAGSVGGGPGFGAPARGDARPPPAAAPLQWPSGTVGRRRPPAGSLGEQPPAAPVPSLRCPVHDPRPPRAAAVGPGLCAPHAWHSAPGAWAPCVVGWPGVAQRCPGVAWRCPRGGAEVAWGWSGMTQSWP